MLSQSLKFALSIVFELLKTTLLSNAMVDGSEVYYVFELLKTTLLSNYYVTNMKWRGVFELLKTTLLSNLK